MIFESIKFIEQRLTAIHGVAANIGEIIALDTGIPPNSEPGIIITLVNIEEDRISRNPINYQRSGMDIHLKNPAINLNLTLLFTAFPKLSYENALKSLQSVIEFFQKQHVFDHTNSMDLDSGIEKLIIEMISINIEQLNNLWSVMGGRYHPSVLYKMRMVTIDSVTEQEGGIIKEIETNFSLKE